MAEPDHLLEADQAINRAEIALGEARDAVARAKGFAAAFPPEPAATAPAPAPGPLAAPSGAKAGIQDAGAFFASLRTAKILGATLEQSEVDGCTAILAACAGKMPAPWTAYALATAFLETAGTMQPVKEANWLSATAQAAYFAKMYDIEGARPAKARELGNLTPGDGARYAGRGYVQLTGRNNYARAERELAAPFLAQPDLAMQADHAAAIMVRGMLEGWFTAKRLNDYINNSPTRDQFVNARRIINGQDRAGDIADHALIFLAALKAGGWQ